MSWLRTLIASDMAQILLGWGRWGAAVLSIASSIPITILGAIVVM